MSKLGSGDSLDFKVRGYTLGQAPNLPVIIAVLAAVLSRFLADGSLAYGLSRAVFFVALTIWAWMELSEGVNGFRRVLGAAGLAFVIYSLTRDLS